MRSPERERRTSNDGFEVAASKPARVELDAPVREVVVFEDRAQVTRRATVDLAVGPVTLVVRDVAPVLADKSLAVQLGAAAQGTVSDVRVCRQLRSVEQRQARDPDHLAATMRSLRAEQARLKGRQRQLETQRTMLATLADLSVADIAVDAAWGRHDAAAWQRAVSAAEGRERELRDALLALGLEIADLEQSLADLARRVAAEQRPDRRLAADILVDLVGGGGSVTVDIRYVVPAACWRPQHSATLVEDDDGARVELASDATVWQCSGEDWDGVALKLSTQRASLGCEPPLLEDDRLELRDKVETTVVEARDQVIRTTGLGAAARVADELPGIDDGGAPLTLSAAHPATVPADGRPHRIAIGRFESPAEIADVLMPELSSAVITRVRLRNAGGVPVLAGPVDLVRGNGLVGRAPVLFVAPGERFALGFGPDPAVRVRRRVDEVELKPGPLSRQLRTAVTVTLLLSNISAEERVFELTERIPVSEVEQVRIELDRETTTPGAEPNADGLLTWRVELAPGGRSTIRLRYVVEKHRDVRGV